VTVGLLTFEGTDAGVTAFDAVDTAPVPNRFFAFTVKV